MSTGEFLPVLGGVVVVAHRLLETRAPAPDTVSRATIPDAGEVSKTKPSSGTGAAVVLAMGAAGSAWAVLSAGLGM